MSKPEKNQNFPKSNRTGLVIAYATKSRQSLLMMMVAQESQATIYPVSWGMSLGVWIDE